MAIYSLDRERTTGGPAQQLAVTSAPTTGGPLPATPVPKVPVTGGPLPATPVSAPTTGGPLPATPINTGVVPPHMQTGGNLPAQPISLESLNGYVAQVTPGSGTQTSPNQVVQQALAAILDNNGAYMQNARQNGLDFARNRGLLNSSIAAGNSQRAAIDAAQPLVNQIVGINNNREQMAFTGQQNQLNRIQGVNNAALQARLQDWVGSQNFTRQFNGQLAMMPITNAFQLSNAIAQYALENPEVYTPTVVSSLNNFFNQNMFSILRQYFPGMVQQTPGGTS